MLIGMMKGYLAVLVIGTLCILPLCLCMPFAEALLQIKRSLVVMGWYWLVCGPPTILLCRGAAAWQRVRRARHE